MRVPIHFQQYLILLLRHSILGVRAVILPLWMLVGGAPVFAGGSNNVNVTYHWHLHQPIYWPDKHPNLNRYQFGAESVDLKNRPGGQYYPNDSFNHPRNSLSGEVDSCITALRWTMRKSNRLPLIAL